MKGIEKLDDMDYDKAISWFNSAESNADESLIKEIQMNRQKIASELLDSLQYFKNQLTLSDAINLAITAGDLYPENERQAKILGNLYFEKAILNEKIGNYNGALDYYQKAIDTYPNMDHLIMEQLKNISQKFIRVAYDSFQNNEYYLVIKSMKDFLKLRPNMVNELEPFK